MPLIHDPKPFDSTNDKWVEPTNNNQLTADQQHLKAARIVITSWFIDRKKDGRLGNYLLDEIYKIHRNHPVVQSYLLTFDNEALKAHRLYIIKSIISENIKAFIDNKDVKQ